LAFACFGMVYCLGKRDSMWKTGIPVVAAAHGSTGGLEDTGEEEEAEPLSSWRWDHYCS
ncbi:hypothetical protein JG688_00013615, partial [Phytophthora aleatoria]